jgi:sugar lactone lactonase YvrE
MRRAAPALAAAVLAAALALPAAAHEGLPGVRFGDLEEYVGERLEATAEGDPKVHAAYVRAGRILQRESAGKLAVEVAKVAALRKEWGRRLASDGGLGVLLNAALEEIRVALAARPEAFEEDMDDVEGKRRRSPERAAVQARDLALEARSGALDAGKRLVLQGRSARGWAKAAVLVEKAVARQGGPVEGTVAAETGRIYAAIGTGSGGFNGDGRAARRSSLYWVEEVKFGPDGNLYILDWNNHMLRRRESDGTLSRVCGKGSPGDSEGDPLETELNHPSAVDFDAAGRVYIAAWHNHKVKVFDPTGEAPTVYTIAGTIQGNSGDGDVATAAKFNLLPGILRIPAGHPLGEGNLLATDAANQCVRRILVGTAPETATNVAGVEVTTGEIERLWGTGTQGHGGDGGPAAEATLGFAKAQNAESDGRMALDAAGNVFLVSGVENVIRKVAPDGTITTVAGDGTAGHSGDGGAATDARLRFPSDVAVAADGTLYISDQLNHVIRRVDPEGTITTFAGSPGIAGSTGDGGPASAALLRRPAGLELDADGNLWVCDKGNSVVRVIPTTTPGLAVPVAPYFLPAAALGRPPAKGTAGVIETYAGTGVSSFNGDGLPARETDFYWPQDVAVEPASGLLHVVDWNNHRIRRVEDDGTVSPVMGVGELGDTDGPALAVRMNHPTDIAFHPVTGELHVATWHTDRVKRLVASSHVVETVNRPDGKRAFSGEGLHVSFAEFNLPSSVKFDGAGNMYVGDAGNRRVRRVDATTGAITTIAGTGEAGFSGDEGPGVEATFNLPVGQSAQPAGRICIDPTNAYLYVADTDNHRVRRLDLVSGDIDTVAGDGFAAYDGDGSAATAASLSSPTDVDCDAAGNLYICDRDNHAVRKVTLATGLITTVAGTGVAGYEGDGGPGSSALLNLPSGIFVDRSSGRLFVADTFNGVVRVVWE